MSVLDKMKINDTVNFEVYPSALLGTGFKNCKVLAILDADTAKLFNIDPPALHISVYPTLPVGTPDRYDGYSYLKIRLANGNITCIGVPWIKESSITAVTYTTARIEIPNCGVTDLAKITEALIANGYTPNYTELV